MAGAEVGHCESLRRPSTTPGTERPEVFNAVHVSWFRRLNRVKARGIRSDHPDGRPAPRRARSGEMLTRDWHPG
ncbi:MAG: hypothetical protein ACKODX_05725 [Gemmata sp.]